MMDTVVMNCPFLRNSLYIVILHDLEIKRGGERHGHTEISCCKRCCARSEIAGFLEVTSHANSCFELRKLAMLVEFVFENPC
jgi:hypothetical protein